MLCSCIAFIWNNVCIRRRSRASRVAVSNDYEIVYLIYVLSIHALVSMMTSWRERTTYSHHQLEIICHRKRLAILHTMPLIKLLFHTFAVLHFLCIEIWFEVKVANNHVLFNEFNLIHAEFCWENAFNVPKKMYQMCQHSRGIQWLSAMRFCQHRHLPIT